MVVVGDLPYGLDSNNKKEGYQKQIDPVWSRDQFEGFMKVIAKITNGQESNVFLFGSDIQVVTRLPNYWDRIVKEENQWEVSY